jgi:hypothetical protein
MSRNNVIMKPMRQESIGFFKNNNITPMVTTIVKIIMPMCFPVCFLSLMSSHIEFRKAAEQLELNEDTHKRSVNPVLFVVFFLEENSSAVAVRALWLQYENTKQYFVVLGTLTFGLDLIGRFVLLYRKCLPVVLILLQGQDVLRWSSTTAISAGRLMTVLPGQTILAMVIAMSILS